MPKYSFLCPNCGSEKTIITSFRTSEIDCISCDGKMTRQMPTIAGQRVFETVDTYNNIKHEKDQTEIVKHRRDTHYWEVEVPRLVEEYSLETCLEQKWLVYNEKGELVINKPPNKR